MTIQQLVKLKQGQHFIAQGKKATVVWTESEDIEMGIFDHEMKYIRHRAIAYSTPGTSHITTLRSMWPFPDKNEFKDYSEYKEGMQFPA